MAPKKTHTDIVFDDYAPTCVVPEGATIVGVFEKVTLGPDVEVSPGITQKPPIVTFEAISGESIDVRTGEISPLQAGDSYSLWLLGTVLRANFVEARPEAGERFAVRSNGTRTKRGMSADQEHATYASYSVAFPDRPQIDRAVSWADLG